MNIFTVLSIIFIAIVAFVFRSFVFGPFITHFPIFKNSDDYYYNVFTKQVYYSQMGNWFALSFEALPGVKKDDQLKLVDRIGVAYGKRFFLEGDEKPEIDASVDITLTGFYIKNAGNAYYYVNYHSLQLVPGIDFATFQSSKESPGYATDKNSVYWENQLLPGANPKSFKTVDSQTVSHDDRNIFFVITDEGGKVFKIEKFALKSSQVQALDRVFHDGHQIFYINYRKKEVVAGPLLNPASIKITDDELIYDSTRVVWKDLY